MPEKELDLEWVRKPSVIIHYCGRNMPWKENYLGQLDVFYHEMENIFAERDSMETVAEVSM